MIYSAVAAIIKRAKLNQALLRGRGMKNGVKQSKGLTFE
jgi:hypothetical protein